MKWFWIIGGIGVMIGFLALLTDYFRLGKTVVLILRTSPYQQAGTGERRLLVLGDSTGYGTGVTNAKESIAGRIGTDFPDVTIVNNSVNGRTLKQLADETTTLPATYDVILLQMGANDILGKRPVEAAMADLMRLYETLTPYAQEIVIMPSGNVGGASAFTETPKAAEYEKLSREYYAALAEFAQNHPHFTFVNLFEEPAIDPFIIEPKKYLAMDGLHPNGAGYALWYETLKPVLTPLLGRQ